VRHGADLPAGQAELSAALGPQAHVAYFKADICRADLLVVNAVGDGRAFEVLDNAGWLLGADGSEVELPTGSKGLLASRVWDAVAARLDRPS